MTGHMSQSGRHPAPQGSPPIRRGQDPLIAYFPYAVLLYFLIQSLSFSLFKTGADIDTAELLLYNQYWSLGYGGSQPPLYNWITHLITDLFGVSLLVLSVTKFAFIAVCFLFVFLSARELGFDRRLAAISSLGIFAMPEVAWETQRSLSHSVALIAFCAIAFFFFARLKRRRTLLNYAAFGLSAAAIVLSKYNGAVFVVSLIIASLLLPRWRAIVTDRRILLSLLVFVAVTAPHFGWALSNQDAVMHRYSRFAVGAEGSFAADRLAGMRSLIWTNLLTISVILIPVTVALLWRRMREGRSSRLFVDDASLFLVSLFFVFQALILVAILATGATSVLNRWMQPVLIFFPMMVVALFCNRNAAVSNADRSGVLRADRIVYVISLVSALAILIALPLDSMHHFRNRAHISNLDYAGLLERWNEEIGSKPSTVIANDTSLFANLLLQDSQLTVLNPFLLSRGLEVVPPAVVAWTGNEAAPSELKSDLAQRGRQVDWSAASIAPAFRIGAPDELIVIHYVSLDDADRSSPSTGQ